jgi:hypothetical protein
MLTDASFASTLEVWKSNFYHIQKLCVAKSWKEWLVSSQKYTRFKIFNTSGFHNIDLLQMFCHWSLPHISIPFLHQQYRHGSSTTF